MTTRGRGVARHVHRLRLIGHRLLHHQDALGIGIHPLQPGGPRPAHADRSSGNSKRSAGATGAVGGAAVATAATAGATAAGTAAASACVSRAHLVDHGSVSRSALDPIRRARGALFCRSQRGVRCGRRQRLGLTFAAFTVASFAALAVASTAAAASAFALAVAVGALVAARFVRTLPGAASVSSPAVESACLPGRRAAAPVSSAWASALGPSARVSSRSRPPRPPRRRRRCPSRSPSAGAASAGTVSTKLRATPASPLRRATVSCVRPLTAVRHARRGASRRARSRRPSSPLRHRVSGSSSVSA